jgi:hypothetical protein
MISLARHGRPEAIAAAAARTAVSRLSANGDLAESVWAGASPGREHATPATRTAMRTASTDFMCKDRLSFRI